MSVTQLPTPPLPAETVAPVATNAPEACVNCGRKLAGPYCTACGERRASDRDNSFWGFAKEALQTLTNTDRSFLSSVKILLSRPGELTAEFMRGRRVGLMRPLQLFLLVNVVYFLVATVNHNDLLTTSLRTHMTDTWHEGLATRMVENRLGKATVTADVYEDKFESYRRRFDSTTAVQAKTLIFVMVPAFALLAGLLHIGRRRYVVEHLTFALHFYAAFLLLAILLPIVIAIPMGLVDAVMRTNAMRSPLLDPLFGLISSMVLFWYLRRALRRAYGDGAIFSVVGALLLTGGLVLILFGYRMVLFLATYFAVG